MPLERTLELLAKEAGVDGFHVLRRAHVFKIGVNFDPDSLKNRTEVTKTSTTQKVEVGPRDAQFFRALQTPLPLIERPFDELARGVGASEDELIEFAKHHFGGAVRRYVGTLRHRKLGVKENGMVVWRVARRGSSSRRGTAREGPGSQPLLRAQSAAEFSLHALQHGSTDRVAKVAAKSRVRFRARRASATTRCCSASANSRNSGSGISCRNWIAGGASECNEHFRRPRSSS